MPWSVFNCKGRICISLFLVFGKAYQDNDPRKYSVATVEVRVLAVNNFHPVFEMAKYQGFVTVEKASASLVNTYGNRALMLHVQDRDFENVSAKNAQIQK